MKLGLSLFLLYHLVVILVGPNPSSILWQEVAPFTDGYASTFGLLSSWEFFAPNPGPERYIELDLNDGVANDPTVIKYWPPKQRHGFLTDNYNRRFYHSFLTTMNEERVVKYFKPWVCRHYPHVTSFSMQAVRVQVPTIQLADIDEAPNFADISKPVAMPAESLQCKNSSLGAGTP